MSAPIPIFIEDLSGEQYGVVEADARTLVAKAEQLALQRGKPKRTAGGVALEDRLAEEGFQFVDDKVRRVAAQELEYVRQGKQLDFILVKVKPIAGRTHPARVKPKGFTPMSDTQNALTFFEQERQFPDEDANAWYESLVGLDVHKQRLLTELELILFPERLETWSKEHHQTVLHLVRAQHRRVPLIILEGDVGTGKTALAETVGDALARQVEAKVHLLKVNAQVRGSGQVGEMTQLIAQAFRHAERYAKTHKGEPVLLLFDEADSLTESRELQQMHHEDRAGLNALLQQLDNLRLGRLPIAILFITNRPDAIDPAVKRRAALNLTFERPNGEARRQLFRSLLLELDLGEEQLKRLVAATGKRNDTDTGFTASDITDRLLPTALRRAYPHTPLTAELIHEVAKDMTPTAPFQSEKR